MHCVYVPFVSSYRNKMERNVTYCLLCNKPQQAISTHLKRVCMVSHTQGEREKEASRAIASQHQFAREGRVWDFAELEGFCKDTESCFNLCRRLQSRGFIIENTPEIFPTIPPTERYDCLITTTLSVI